MFQTLLSSILEYEPLKAMGLSCWINTWPHHTDSRILYSFKKNFFRLLMVLHILHNKQNKKEMSIQFPDIPPALHMMPSTCSSSLASHPLIFAHSFYSCAILSGSRCNTMGKKNKLWFGRSPVQISSRLQINHWVLDKLFSQPQFHKFAWSK